MMKRLAALIGECDDLGLVCNQAADEKFIAIVLRQTFMIMGAMAVIFIIIGGIRYSMSVGDSGKIKAAKDTILYAVIGLGVSLLAFVIVNLTLGTVGDITG